jgi:DNA-binding beta-propeller fold protein YncE
VITEAKRRQGVNRREFVLGAIGLAAGGADPVGLVTADLEAHVVVVDLARGRVVRRIATPTLPRSIEAVGAAAVVAHSEIGRVSLIRGGRVAHVLGGFAEPRYTAAHPDRRHAYVTDAKRGEVVTIDVARGRAVSRVPVGPLARHLSFDAGASRLWIALGSKAAASAVLDVSRRDRPRLVGRLRPPFLAHDIGFAPDLKHVWVTSADRNEIAIYDPLGRLERRISADWPPQHVSFGSGRAFVSSGWSGTLNVHDTAGAHIRRTVVPVGSYNVQHADGSVLTPGLGTGTLTILDGAGAVRSELRVARSSHDATVVGT